MGKNGIHFELDDDELKIFKANVLASGCKNQTEFIKSKILSNFDTSETKEDQQQIKDLLFKIIEQNDMIQKILLTGSIKDDNIKLLNSKIKLLQKQQYVTHIVTTQTALQISLQTTLNLNKNNQEIKYDEMIYQIIEEAKKKADEIFGKEE